MDEITTLISNIGFPIAVAVWLLVTQKSQMAELKDAVDNNTKVVEKLLDKLDLEVK